MLGNWVAAPLAAASGALILLANQPLYESLWRYHAGAMAEVGRQIAAGDLSSQSLARIFPQPPEYLPGAIRRLQALRLGPFAHQ
jgi:hypothetical protein